MLSRQEKFLNVSYIDNIKFSAILSFLEGTSKYNRFALFGRARDGLQL